MTHDEFLALLARCSCRTHARRPGVRFARVALELGGASVVVERGAQGTRFVARLPR